MNPSTAFATALVDELIRCGLADAVIAPGSRSAPLAMALWRRAEGGGARAGEARLRLHVRTDERSASFLALGLAKASRRPVVVSCTSGTAAAHFHAAVVEADEAGVPLIVLTADRPPELRGTGANQTIDQVKLYGGAVRWFCEAGVPEARPGMNSYWRSLACRAWAEAAGAAGGLPGPAHVNVPLREPLVPGQPDPAAASPAGGAASPGGGAGWPGGWPEPPDGRPDGSPWTRFPTPTPAAQPPGPSAASLSWLRQPRHSLVVGDATATIAGPALEVAWVERGAVVCGDGDYDPGPVLELAGAAGWPVLAEPSSGARQGANALSAYPYLLGSAEFVAAHRPELIVSAGRPTLSRGQLAYLRTLSPTGAPPRHVVLAQGPGRWADPARTATDVAFAIRLVGGPKVGGVAGEAEGGGAAGDPQPAGGGVPGTAWLRSWRAADAAARLAADEALDAGDALSEPRLARDLVRALPDGALLWAAASLPIRDLDLHMPARAIRVLANRGASGIDGLVSASIGAALAHQAAGGGPAVALLGDLAFVHDAPGLFVGPHDLRPDLAIVVVNNDGGGIFSLLEQAAFPDQFERIFGTPHGGSVAGLAAAAGVPATTLERAADLPDALSGSGLRVVEVRTSRAEGAALRERLRTACAAAVGAAITR